MAKKNKIGRLNRWLTLGANIGVVFGLIIPIVEVRQNAKLTRANMEITRNSFLAEIELNIAKPEISKVWIKSIRNPEDLTDSEMRTVEALLVSLMLQWDVRFKMEDAGLVSRGEARQHILNNAKFYFGSRFAKHWWSLQSSGWEGTPMMEVAGPIVDGIDENFLADYMDNLRIEPQVPEVVGGAPALPKGEDIEENP